MKYLLLSSRRSGSALLKHALIDLFNENIDGPDEWIINSKTREILNLPADLAEAKALVLKNPDLLIDRMSPNSHRKVMYSQLLDPKNLPKNVPIIHLIRKDAWSQAKSAFIMRKKIIPPHVTVEKNTKDGDEQLKINIDINQIDKIAKQMLLDKEYWYRCLLNRKNTLTLFYEDDLIDINVFNQITLPKIEQFLNKKRLLENYKFRFVKTRNLYEIKNISKDEELQQIENFYFHENKINKLKFYKRRLKNLIM